MIIEFDVEKRRRTVEERGLDFEDTLRVFEGRLLTRVDDRRDYGEERFITIGALDQRIVVIVWTKRRESVRVISMRLAHDHERKAYREFVDRS